MSLWSESVVAKEYPTLTFNLKTEVAIIGGGLSGLLTAYYLKRRGIDCVILERDRIGGGVTQNTTAKITAQHGRIYDRLIKGFGSEKAQKYARANLHAIEEYERIIKELQIMCHFERQPSYLYTTDDPKGLAAEQSAAESLGIDCALVDKAPLPFENQGALCFENQAQFHPMEFLTELSKQFLIYERTPALDVRDHTVDTPNATVSADHIVFACHFPFINRLGNFYLKMHQSITYVIALLQTDRLTGMYKQDKDDGLTLRGYENYLLFGGMGHRSGVKCPGDVYASLEHLAKIYFPRAELKYAWSNLDCMTQDSLPYAGKLSKKNPDLYVATGFNKWGITNSLAAGRLISDLISGQENPYEQVYSPERTTVVQSAKQFVADGATIAGALTKEIFVMPSAQINELKKGTGAIVTLNGEKAGVYKDPYGEVFVVDVKCPHLGCELAWNENDLTWDCPCHGSRFGYDGTLFHSPAGKGLACRRLNQI